MFEAAWQCNCCGSSVVSARCYIHQPWLRRLPVLQSLLICFSISSSICKAAVTPVRAAGAVARRCTCYTAVFLQQRLCCPACKLLNPVLQRF